MAIEPPQFLRSVLGFEHHCAECRAKFEQACRLSREIFAHCPAPGFNADGTLRADIRAALERGDEVATTPEDTLADAGISTKRQARYQRRMSKLLAGRA